MIGRRIVTAAVTVGLVALSGLAVVRPAAAISFPDEIPFDQGRFEAAQTAGKPILVHITASWCSVCATQKRILDDLRRQDKFKPLLIFNVDFDAQKDLVRKFRAHAQSTMVVFKGKLEEGIFSGDTRPKAVALLLSRAF